VALLVQCRMPTRTINGTLSCGDSARKKRPTVFVKNGDGSLAWLH
jgi:hypothetical protein